MKKEYDTIVGRLEDLVEGKEIEIVIRDLTPGPLKYESHYVRATVSRSPERLPGGSKLWVRFTTGVRHPSPWAIKVLEELAELPK